LLVHRDIYWSIVEVIFKNIGGDKFDFKETTIRIFSPICFQFNRGDGKYNSGAQYLVKKPCKKLTKN
jgi:hypothetical protein